MADSAYLMNTVGDALSMGVAATVQAQPHDPIDYLAQWLLRYLLVPVLASEPVN